MELCLLWLSHNKLNFEHPPLSNLTFFFYQEFFAQVISLCVIYSLHHWHTANYLQKKYVVRSIQFAMKMNVFSFSNKLIHKNKHFFYLLI